MWRSSGAGARRSIKCRRALAAPGMAELVAEDMSNMNPEEQKEFLKEFLEHLNPQDRQSLLTALGMGPVN